MNDTSKKIIHKNVYTKQFIMTIGDYFCFSFIYLFIYLSIYFSIDNASSQCGATSQHKYIPAPSL